MPKNKKGISTKLYLAIVLLIIIALAAFAVIYATYTPPIKAAVPGVHAGDTFSYSLQGVSILGLDAVEPGWLAQYNDTDFYKVTITDVNGSVVSLNSAWKFKNGTEITYPQTIDLSTGNETNRNTGFWVIYATNLNVNDRIRPGAGQSDTTIVNGTDTKTYANSTRQRNIFTLQNEFFNTNDPTYSTYRNDVTSIYFDKQTGMLDTLTNVQQYNNPQMNIIITWRLLNTSVWQV